MAKIKGFVFYRGPSQIDGSPIVGIATLHSRNSKTGDMVHTWILNDNGLSPLENIKNGADYSVCGYCKHRRHTGGACYVDVGKAPTSVWKSYMKGNYPIYTGEVGKYEYTEGIYFGHSEWEKHVQGREVRVGAYGDPFGIPFEVWEWLLQRARKHTGYTHQWQRDDFKYSRISEICMASVDNEQEYTQAKSKGYRTFRVLSDQEVTLKPKEFMCPATPEGGNKRTCQTCCACSGIGIAFQSRNPNKADVAVVVHGALKKRFTQQTVGTSDTQ